MNMSNVDASRVDLSGPGGFYYGPIPPHVPAMLGHADPRPFQALLRQIEEAAEPKPKIRRKRRQDTPNRVESSS